MAATSTTSPGTLALPATSATKPATPIIILRLEGLALLTVAIAAYAHFGFSWRLFAILFLAPDLAFVFYLFGTAVGAVFYNAAHSTLGPLGLGAFGFATANPLLIAAALIWLAHIGFDRALGYGLKYADAFAHTHLSAKSQ
jgi:hypothetical protein